MLRFRRQYWNSRQMCGSFIERRDWLEQGVSVYLSQWNCLSLIGSIWPINWILWRKIAVNCVSYTTGAYDGISRNGIKGLAQGCGNSNALAVGLLQSCTEPSPHVFLCLWQMHFSVCHIWKDLEWTDLRYKDIPCKHEFCTCRICCKNVSCVFM